jgi:hypothetical protein
MDQNWKNKNKKKHKNTKTIFFIFISHTMEMDYTTDDTLSTHILPLLLSCMRIRHYVSMEFVRLSAAKDNTKVLSNSEHVDNIVSVLDEVIIMVNDVIKYAGSASLISYSMFMRAKHTYEHGCGCQYEGEARDVIVTRSDIKMLKEIQTKMQEISFSKSHIYIDEIINK